MITRHDLAAYLTTLLQPEKYQDYCPNGLQVEGKLAIQKIVTGVTACQALLDAALAAEADAILVHHGFFWKGEDARVIGMKHARLKTLLLNDINLFGYHLPLDGHASLGNNSQLAKLLDLEITGDMDLKYGKGVGLIGRLKQAVSAQEFSSFVEEKLEHKPLHFSGSNKKIQTIAWCTGGAPDCLLRAAELGVDAYLTGEVRENTFHEAQESGIHFFAAGHHATERYGIKAVGEHLAETFKIEHRFIDIPNPV